MTLAEETAGMRLYGVVANMALIVGILLLWPSGTISFGFPLTPPGLGLLSFFLMLTMAIFLFARGGGKQESVPIHVSALSFSFLYIAILGAHVLLLTRLPDGHSTSRNSWVFLALAATFLGDTMAYFFGRGFGGPKLYPAVSPKKTWAGLIGCMVGGIGGAFAVQWILLPKLLWWDCVIIGLACAILGQIGDFSESLLKRAYHVKDSGTILPGHGGLLDRIDALLFNGSFLFYYAVWVILAR
jgi:phosphatidate cytidylyltransferase